MRAASHNKGLYNLSFKQIREYHRSLVLSPSMRTVENRRPKSLLFNSFRCSSTSRYKPSSFEILLSSNSCRCKNLSSLLIYLRLMRTIENHHLNSLKSCRCSSTGQIQTPSKFSSPQIHVHAAVDTKASCTQYRLDCTATLPLDNGDATPTVYTWRDVQVDCGCVYSREGGPRRDCG